MGEAAAFPDILDDLATTLLRQGFTVTQRGEDEFGDQLVELTHGHRAVLFSCNRGRWSIDVRLIDRWFAPPVVEAALQGRAAPAPRRPSLSGPPAPPSLDELALSTLGVVGAMPTSAAALRDLRDQVVLSQRRRRVPFLGNWDRRR